jgi:ribosomal protein S18 acetylase RimI-like enzyme
MDVSAAETDDVDRLVDLWVSLAEGQREHGSHLLSEANRNRIRESVVQHVVSDSLLIADTGELAGFVMFSTGSGGYEQDCVRGVIENLYVRPRYRDDGIGATLLETAEERLGADGVDAVALEVMAANEDARRFYRRQGYRPHRVELEKPMGDDEQPG